MITTPLQLTFYALAVASTAMGCFSTGKNKTSWPSTDFDTFPFCNPDDITLTSAQPAQRKVGGTWLQKTQQGVISTSKMLEFKTIGEDKYAFQMTAIGRVNIDSLTVTIIQENVNKMSGTAIAASDEILLNIVESKIQLKSAKTEADLDNEKFKEEHTILFKQGKIRMKLLNGTNQIGSVSACNITTANNAKMQLGNWSWEQRTMWSSPLTFLSIKGDWNWFPNTPIARGITTGL